MDPEQPEDTPTTPQKGYDKRPTWQWVLIYLIIAVIVYGLIYYFVIRDTGGDGSLY